MGSVVPVVADGFPIMMSRKHVLLIGIGLILMLSLVARLVWLRTPAYTVIRNQDFEGVIFSKGTAADQLGVMLLNEHDP